MPGKKHLWLVLLCLFGLIPSAVTAQGAPEEQALKYIYDLFTSDRPGTLDQYVMDDTGLTMWELYGEAATDPTLGGLFVYLEGPFAETPPVTKCGVRDIVQGPETVWTAPWGQPIYYYVDKISLGFRLYIRWVYPHHCASIVVSSYDDNPHTPEQLLELTTPFIEALHRGMAEAGLAGAAPTPLPTIAGPDCAATIHYDPNLKPGDILSPWTTYVAVPDGGEVIPIGEAFFINGQPAHSITWDGRETTIELQYTCPGHQGHITSLVVPAFGGDTPTPTPTASPTLPPPPPAEAEPDTGPPTPTDTATPTPTPTPTAEAKKCPSLSAAAKLNRILQLYYASIPKGLTDSGKKNNILSVWDDKYDEFVCGAYQGKVLRFLDGLKFNDDPCLRELLDDWDYGPIQAYWGGHQAVVIYPRGTDWLVEGLVLDPWITQSPQVYDIQSWVGQWSLHSYQGIGGSGTYAENDPRYPTVGGNYAPPGSPKLTAEETRLIQSLPPEKQAIIRDMDPATRTAWLRQAMARRARNRSLSANSPVDLYLVDDQGRKSGFVAGQPVAELPDVRFRRFPLADGHHWTEVEYPADRDYTLNITGTDSGSVRLFHGVNMEPGVSRTVYQYDFPVQTGQSYEGRLAGPDHPLQSGQMNVSPVIVPAVDLAWLEAQPELVQPPPYAAGETAVSWVSLLPDNRLIWLFGGCAGLLIVGLMGGVAGVVVIRLGRSQAGFLLPMLAGGTIVCLAVVIVGGAFIAFTWEPEPEASSASQEAAISVTELEPTPSPTEPPPVETATPPPPTATPVLVDNTLPSSEAVATSTPVPPPPTETPPPPTATFTPPPPTATFTPPPPTPIPTATNELSLDRWRVITNDAPLEQDGRLVHYSTNDFSIRLERDLGDDFEVQVDYGLVSRSRDACPRLGLMVLCQDYNSLIQFAVNNEVCRNQFGYHFEGGFLYQKKMRFRENISSLNNGWQTGTLSIQRHNAIWLLSYRTGNDPGFTPLVELDERNVGEGAFGQCNRILLFANHWEEFPPPKSFEAYFKDMQIR